MSELLTYRAVTAARELMDVGIPGSVAASMAAERFGINVWHVRALASEAVAGLALARLSLIERAEIKFEVEHE